MYFSGIWLESIVIGYHLASSAIAITTAPGVKLLLLGLLFQMQLSCMEFHKSLWGPGWNVDPLSTIDDFLGDASALSVPLYANSVQL